MGNRADVAALKRRLAEFERKVNRLGKESKRKADRRVGSAAPATTFKGSATRGELWAGQCRRA